MQDFDSLLAICEYAISEAIAVTSGKDATLKYFSMPKPAFLAEIEMPVPPRVTAPLAPDKKNLLYVGDLDQRKNLSRVVEALAQLPERLRNDIRLVITGYAMATELNMLIHALIVAGLQNDNLVLYSFASDREIIGLFKTTVVLIQPPVLAGFGLIALEGTLSVNSSI